MVSTRHFAGLGLFALSATFSAVQGATSSPTPNPTTASPTNASPTGNSGFQHAVAPPPGLRRFEASPGAPPPTCADHLEETPCLDAGCKWNWNPETMEVWCAPIAGIQECADHTDETSCVAVGCYWLNDVCQPGPCQEQAMACARDPDCSAVANNLDTDVESSVSECTQNDLCLENLMCDIGSDPSFSSACLDEAEACLKDTECAMAVLKGITDPLECAKNDLCHAFAMCHVGESYLGPCQEHIVACARDPDCSAVANNLDTDVESSVSECTENELCLEILMCNIGEDPSFSSACLDQAEACLKDTECAVAIVKGITDPSECANNDLCYAFSVCHMGQSYSGPCKEHIEACMNDAECVAASAEAETDLGACTENELCIKVMTCYAGGEDPKCGEHIEPCVRSSDCRDLLVIGGTSDLDHEVCLQQEECRSVLLCHGGSYDLVFRQSSPYTWVEGQLTLNEDDLSAENFARLDRIEDYRIDDELDGRFHFKMTWPGIEEVMPSGVAPRDLEWFQRSNPLTATWDDAWFSWDETTTELAKFGGLRMPILEGQALMVSSITNPGRADAAEELYRVGESLPTSEGVQLLETKDGDRIFAKQVELYAFRKLEVDPSKFPLPGTLECADRTDETSCVDAGCDWLTDACQPAPATCSTHTAESACNDADKCMWNGKMCTEELKSGTSSGGSSNVGLAVGLTLVGLVAVGGGIFAYLGGHCARFGLGKTN